jgi:hypothetical protein
VVTELIKLLAQNVASFTKKYAPHEHPRIMQYLRTRSKRQVVTPSFLNVQLKGKEVGPAKRQKIPGHKPPQRAWNFLQEPALGLTPPAPYQPKGNNYTSKAKGKPTSSKGKGKSSSKGKGKSKGKGSKSSFKGKAKDNKGSSTPGLVPKLGEVNHGHLMSGSKEACH